MTSDPALLALLHIENAVFRVCTEHPLATMGEGHVKGAVLRALLESGFAVLEGSTKGAKVLQLQSGTLVSTVATVPEMEPLQGSSKSRLSPDVRVWSPARMSIEIQCRCAWGTQDALSSGNILDDLDRICAGRADVFLFAADRTIYDALRGLKRSTRGRKASAPLTFSRLFPPSEELHGDTQGFEPEDPRYGVKIIARKTNPIWGIERVCLAIVGIESKSDLSVAAV